MLKYQHIKQTADQALQYIHGRHAGTIKSLKTSKESLNEALMDGVEWNKIFTIAGMSGSGKSTIVEEFKRDFVDYNKDQKFSILSFEFEMAAYEQFSRNISGKLEQSIQWLFSANKTVLSDENLAQINQKAEELSKYPIYSVDEVGTVEDVVKTIMAFVADKNLAETKEGLVVTIDHVLLTKGKQGEAEKEIVDDLAHTMIRVKKWFISKGIPILIIMLSQLNRSIENNPERKTNPALHYPNSSDIFGASSLYHSSDYVLITHKPALLGLQNYGPPRNRFPNGLPVYSPKDSEKAMIYWHLLKHRGGEPRILPMVDELKYARIDSYKNL